jgi:hypothetical protein
MTNVTVYPFIDWSASESDNTHPRRYGTDKTIAEAKGVRSGEGIEVDDAELDGNGAITIERLQRLKLVT